MQWVEETASGRLAWRERADVRRMARLPCQGRGMSACCLQRGVRRRWRSQEDPGVQRWESHQHAPGGLILGGRRGDVLGDRVDVPQARWRGLRR